MEKIYLKLIFQTPHIDMKNSKTSKLFFFHLYFLSWATTYLFLLFLVEILKWVKCVQFLGGKLERTKDPKERKLELFDIIIVILIIEILYRVLKPVIQFLTHQTDVLP